MSPRTAQLQLGPGLASPSPERGVAYSPIVTDTQAEPHSVLEALAELRDEVYWSRPRWRLHISTGINSLVHLSSVIHHDKLDPHVVLVPDPDVPVGRARYETITPGRWLELQNLVGTRVVLRTHELGELTGVLVDLGDKDAVIDLAPDDRRYVIWLSVEPAPAPAPEPAVR